jgi:hypothetical protein
MNEWTAIDYDRIEYLQERYQLPPSRIARLLDRPASAEHVAGAMRAAGIPCIHKAGRPNRQQAEAWDALVAQIEADPEDRKRREDLAIRRIEEYAAARGYEIVAMRKQKPPEI